MSTQMWIALLVYAPISSIMGMLGALMYRALSVPDYDPGMDYAGGFYLFGGLLIGGILGFAVGLLPDKPRFALSALGVIVFLVLVWLTVMKER